MATLFATIGFHPDRVMRALEQRPEWTNLHVFYGPKDHPEHEAPRKALDQVAAKLGRSVTWHLIDDPFDYTQCFQTLRAAHKQVKGQVALLGSGGPRPMNYAASIYCYTNGLSLYYNDEYGNDELIEMPLAMFREVHQTKPTRRRILEYVEHHGPVDMSTIANAVGVTAGTLSVHVSELVEQRALSSDKVGRQRFITAGPGLQAALAGST